MFYVMVLLAKCMNNKLSVFRDLFYTWMQQDGNAPSANADFLLFKRDCGRRTRARD